MRRRSTQASMLKIIEYVRVKGRMEAAKFLQRQVQQRLVFIQTVGNQLPHDLVRVPEGDPLAHQIVRAIGGVGEAARMRPVSITFSRKVMVRSMAVNTGRLFQQRVPRVEEGLFVLLHILVIGQRNALHHGQQGDQIAVDPAGFATQQLRHVRVFLLRHDGGAGGERVVHLHKMELGGAPQDQFLAEAAQMHHADGGGGKIVQQEIPVGSRRPGCFA